MPTIFLLALILHIAAGAATLLLGIWIGIRRKADDVHRRLGIWFVRAMVVVCATSVIMAVIHPNAFLLLIAAFSGYQSVMGRRAWKAGPGTRTADILMASGLILVGMSQFVIAFRTNITDVIIPLFFAVLIIGQGGSDLLVLLSQASGKVTRRAKMIRHIGQMGGAMIASWTAFLIQNVPPALEVVAWIVPSIVGAWYIARAIRRHAPANTPAITLRTDRHRAHEIDPAADLLPDGHTSVGSRSH